MGTCVVFVKLSMVAVLFKWKNSFNAKFATSIKMTRWNLMGFFDRGSLVRFVVSIGVVGWRGMGREHRREITDRKRSLSHFAILPKCHICVSGETRSPRTCLGSPKIFDIIIGSNRYSRERRYPFSNYHSNESE